jgi:hypothetical protein
MEAVSTGKSGIMPRFDFLLNFYACGQAFKPCGFVAAG